MLSSFAGGIGGLIAPIAGAMAGIWGTSAAISGAKDALKQQQLLATVLGNTGHAAGLTQEEISGYAAELQQMTNFEGDATVGAASMLAAFTNIRGDNFFSAMDAAADLSTVMGGDLASNAKMLGKVLNDPTEGISKLAKAGVMLTAEQETLVKSLQKSGDMAGAQGVILDAMSAKFGGAAKASADPWTQLQNALGDVGEMIGSLLLPSINVLATSLTGMLEIVGQGGAWFMSMGIEAAVVLSHIGGLLVLGVTQWELFFVQVGLGAAHFFTETLPTYLTWFGDNFTNVMFTALDYTMTLFINLGQNIRNMWSTVLDYFAGNEVEFNWTPLLEGAASAIDKLPDIPERITTQFEKGLMDQIDAMSTDIGASMEAQRAELTAKFDPAAKVPNFSAPEVDDGGKAGKTATKSLSAAAEFGSSAALSIIANASTKGKDPVEKNTDVIAKNSVKQTGLLQTLADTLNEPVVTVEFAP